MAYIVPVPKDLSKVKTKVMFNLTKRQLICFGLAAIVGIPTYFLLRKVMSSTFAASIMVILILPFFLFALYEKDGMPLEVVLMHIYRQRFQRPMIRPYQTDNFYARIQEEIYEKEVLGIVEKQGKGGGKKKHKKSAE